MQKQSSDTHASQHTNTITSTFASGTLTVDCFSDNSDERTLRQSLESKAFAYMLSKHSLHIKASGETTFKEFCAHSVGSMDQDPSNMYYMELLDENPDSTDTLRHLGECQFCPSDVLVDGKPYEHLMKVQKTTWVRASNLLVFPGDWRTLKNYQPVLMKMYYSVGLKEC